MKNTKKETVKQNKSLRKAFIERFGIDSLDYQVPAHANTLPFTLGGIAAVSLVLTLISGVILAMWYVPMPEEANVSIRSIMETVYLGSVIRGIHYWGATLTLVAVALHVLRVFLYGSYKKPREGNWIIGVLLFGTLMGLFFTGTALKWDQEGYEALAHAKAIAGLVGFEGLFSSQTIPVLLKLFVAHISILPMLLIGLLVIHMLLVKRHQISPLPWKKKQFSEDKVESLVAATSETATVLSKNKSKKHTFLQHLRTLFGYGYIVLGILIILAILAPPQIGPDPIAGIEVTKPLWPFLAIYSVENWFGINGALIVSAVLFIGLLVVPFFDRGTNLSFSKRKYIITIGLSIAIVLIILTIYGVVAEPVVHLDM